MVIWLDPSIVGKKTKDKVKRDLWPALVAAWRIWPFYTFISMYFLPEEWWMPVGYFVGYMFNTYLKLLSVWSDKKNLLIRKKNKAFLNNPIHSTQII